jgi:hypothetical protein
VASLSEQPPGPIQFWLVRTSPGVRCWRLWVILGGVATHASERLSILATILQRRLVRCVAGPALMSPPHSVGRWR